MKILSLIAILLVGLNALAAEKLVATGEVFDIEGKEKKFTYEKYEGEENGKVKVRAVYKDLEGEILVEETMVSSNGEVERYDIDQKQTKKKGWIVVKGDKVEFNLKKFRKRNYPIEKDKPKNFIVGLQITERIKNNWDSILKGDDYNFKLGVWHRQEPISFRIQKDSADAQKTTFKMSASSMLIRAIVDPLYFTFDNKTKGLISYKGRTAPKVKRGKGWYDFDGMTTYKTVEAAPAKK